MKTPVDIYVIEAVRRERMAQRVSQAMLAFGIGVSKSFIGMAESPKYEIKYNYTTPMLIFASLGVLALLFGLWLKVEDKKRGYGLELPNIQK